MIIHKKHNKFYLMKYTSHFINLQALLDSSRFWVGLVVDVEFYKIQSL